MSAANFENGVAINYSCAAETVRAKFWILVGTRWK